MLLKTTGLANKRLERSGINPRVDVAALSAGRSAANR